MSVVHNELFQRLFEGRIFATYDDFVACKQEFEKSTGCTFNNCMSKRSSDASIKFSYSKYLCEFGDFGRKSLSQGIRKSRKTKNLGCNAKFIVVYREGGLRVRSFDITHNHPCGLRLARSSFMNRRLTEEELENLRTFLLTRPPPAYIQQYIKEQFNKSLSWTDVKNMLQTANLLHLIRRRKTRKSGGTKKSASRMPRSDLDLGFDVQPSSSPEVPDSPTNTVSEFPSWSTFEVTNVPSATAVRVQDSPMELTPQMSDSFSDTETNAQNLPFGRTVHQAVSEQPFCCSSICSAIRELRESVDHAQAEETIRSIESALAAYASFGGSRKLVWGLVPPVKTENANRPADLTELKPSNQVRQCYN
ncbi:unnamed protein product [Calicophoron daubneyi]|uniref:FAR1 domain-containing protein n=1 Tax=Calicophoron daubneyi TaxID=300641 RepID=A0AAV2T082_CALDB